MFPAQQQTHLPVSSWIQRCVCCLRQVGMMISAAFFLLLCMNPDAAFAARGLTNFTGKEIRSDNLRPFPKWTGTLERYFNQLTLQSRPCGSVRFNPCALWQWKAKVDSLRGKPILTQLKEINHYLNTVPYVLDPVNWGVPDYWATPNEFFDVNGDCEDYAIAKFISLRALGVPNDKMRIMIVQDMNLGGIVHSILAVNVDGETLILDNQIPNVVRASGIYHYRAIYSINETAWWRH